MKVAFLYCVGSSYLTSAMAKAADLAAPPPSSGDIATVAGLNGRTAVWAGGPPADPFPSLLDPNIFEARKVFYPAAMLGIGPSIDLGIQNVVNEINNLPPGQKFCLGGYSQGAAVMSGVYNELRSGSLTSRNADMIGACMFGNPRRQVDYRGSVGGTWSGAFDIDGSTTGGHGSFPADGPYARLTDCEPLRWIEFAHPGDIITSVGDSLWGQSWVAGNDVLLGTATPGEWAAYLLTSAAIVPFIIASFAVAGVKLTFTDGAGEEFNWLGGNGHVAYPWAAPVGNPDGNLTAYQIALKFLTAKANEYATAPVLLTPTPSTTTSAAWTTTLTPPAA